MLPTCVALQPLINELRSFYWVDILLDIALGLKERIFQCIDLSWALTREF